MTTAWSFLTLEDGDRQFAGNAGYQDELPRHYSWDATVPNHLRVAKRDLAVVRNNDFVLGVGWIDDVATWRDSKDRYRCPSCNRTGFKERTSLVPRFRCPACSSTFNTPEVERLVGIAFFRADYSRTWHAFENPLFVSDIASAYKRNAQQHAIRELDLDQVRRLVQSRQPIETPWWGPRGDGRD